MLHLTAEGSEFLKIKFNVHPSLSTRDITSLDIRAYLYLASNSGSKPQRLGAINCKSSISDKLQTFRTIFDISCKFLTKNYLHEITLFVLKGNLMQDKSQNLSGKKGGISMI